MTSADTRNEVAEYAAALLETWKQHPDCMDQVEAHVESNYPDATPREWEQVEKLLADYSDAAFWAEYSNGSSGDAR